MHLRRAPSSVLLPLVAGLLVALVGGLGQAAGAVPADRAAGPAATALTLTGTSGHAGAPTRLTATLTEGPGLPVVGGTVTFERRTAGAWAGLGSVPTDATGRAVLETPLARDPGENAFRATYVDDASYAPAGSGTVAVALVKRASEVRVEGPGSVVDGRTVPLQVRWRTAAGEPVSGTVRLFGKVRGGEWALATTVRTDAQGRAVHVVRPRTDTAWRATATGTSWARRATSPVHRVDNLPPGRPVRLPVAAPAPRVSLPPQRPAVGQGANVVVSRIPGGVWSSMVGRSWRRGCPVGRAGLRLVRVNYWDYDGYRRRGEVVAAASAAGRIGAALAAMHDRRFPIRSMYRVDRFGWSGRLQGADDYRSMAAGNTSAFNCRWVVGRPGVRSPHSYGRSLDVNPWENPYRASHGWTPNGWWVSRTHPLVAWRSGSHPVVRLMAAHGLSWTYGRADSHHFDARGGSGRVVPAPVRRACGSEVCH